MILAHSEAGEGPPVVLLHGLFGRRQNLGVIARGLTSHFRTISLDLRNHGDSPHDPLMTYETMAADVVETLDALRALPASLVGHSMGGKAAAVLALAHPGQVRRLAVLDIAPVSYAHGNAALVGILQSLPLTPDLTRREADARLAPRITDAALRGFLLQNLRPAPSPGWVLDLDAIAHAIPAIEAWPDLPATALYGGPTLFLRGARSFYLTEAMRPAITARFPLATIETVEGAGHWLHAEQPARVLAALTDFLAPVLRP